MNNTQEETMNYSPEKKKINYYEENPKLFKKKRLRPNINKNPISNNIGGVNISSSQINFNDNIEYNDRVLEMQNNISISQPIIPKNNKNNNVIKCNILDDFLNELEKDGNSSTDYFTNKEKPMGSELKELFTRNKYNAYFQVSRTQNPYYNAWDDFLHKRDKL